MAIRQTRHFDSRGACIKRTLLLALGFFSLSHAAHADWQNLKWGMTKGQVMAAQPNAVPLPEKQRKGWSSASVTAELGMPYETPEFSFLAVFDFSRKTGRLNDVILKLMPKQDAYRLKSALVSRYGSPKKEDSMKVGGEVLFYVASWNSGADHIGWMFWPNNADCSVTYSGSGSVNTDGL